MSDFRAILPQAKSDSGLDDDIVSQLTALQSEYAQLSELDEMEKNYILKLVDSLKELQSGIDSAIPLHVAVDQANPSPSRVQGLGTPALQQDNPQESNACLLIRQSDRSRAGGAPPV